MKITTAGDGQVIAVTTSASSTALSASVLLSDHILVQVDSAAAGAFCRIKTGDSTIAIASSDGVRVHGGSAGVLIKLGRGHTHIAHQASAGTNLSIMPVNPT